jgi:DNA polymerase-3 subunit beta
MVMKFRVEREVLAEALGAAARVASTRNNAMPALSGVKLEVTGDQLMLSCTDNDLSVQFVLPVGGQADGVVVATAKLLSDIVRAGAEGKVTFESVGEEVHISSGRAQTTVATFAASDFPNITLASAPPVTLSAPLLSEALRQVVRAASSDMQRLPLTGVLMSAEPEGLRLVATDSYRLAVRDLPGTNVLGHGQKVVIPSRALGELQRLLNQGDEVTLCLAEDRATFAVGNATLSTSLLQVEFPNYRQLIQPSYPNTLTVAREALLEAVRRCRIFARETTPVRLEMTATSLKLSVITQDIGNSEEEIDCSLEGTEMTVGFNPEYLAAGIEAVTGDEITIQTTDPQRPAVLRGVGAEDYLYLVMPQRLTV